MRQKGTVRAPSRWASEGVCWGGPSEIPFAEGSEGPCSTVNPCNTHLAVLRQDPVSGTEKYISIAPNLGGTGAEVWDIEQYGKTGDLLIAGKFARPTSTEKNLVLVDGTTGKVIRWYNSRPLKTVLAAPGRGRVYGGGSSLSAFDFATAKELWTRSKTSVDPNIRTHPRQQAGLPRPRARRRRQDDLGGSHL